MKRVKIMDLTSMMRSLARITHEIIEKNDDPDTLCLLGVKNRGTIIARILKDNLNTFAGIVVPCGEIDTTMYRDDFTPEEKRLKATESYIPFDVTGKTVIIVDDVLYTGRTARAAIEAIFSLGRPKAVRLAVLIDRGHREIPLKPDHVGKSIPTSRHEKIVVMTEGAEEECGVFIVDNEEGGRE